MKSKTLILITGLPGSGKTTLAELLAEKLSIPVLTTENTRAKLFSFSLDKKDHDFTPEELAITYNALEIIVTKLLAAGSSVIVDGVFRSEQQRAVFQKLSAEYRARFIPIAVTCREDIQLKRLKNRKAHGAITPAGVNTYFALKKEYEQPSAEYLVIDTSDNVGEKLIDMIISKL